MPSGKTHDRIAFALVIPLVLTGELLLNLTVWQNVIFVVAALFCQLMFGPDLDAKSVHYKRWGLLRWIWIPYRKIFRHRSRYSHGILAGTATRIAYFALISTIAMITLDYILYKAFGVSLLIKLAPQIIAATSIVQSKHFIAAALSASAGVFAGGFIHTITDKICSFFKNLL